MTTNKQPEQLSTAKTVEAPAEVEDIHDIIRHLQETPSGVMRGVHIGVARELATEQRSPHLSELYTEGMIPNDAARREKIVGIADYLMRHGKPLTGLHPRMMAPGAKDSVTTQEESQETPTPTGDPPESGETTDKPHHNSIDSMKEALDESATQANVHLARIEQLATDARDRLRNLPADASPEQKQDAEHKSTNADKAAKNAKQAAAHESAKAEKANRAAQLQAKADSKKKTKAGGEPPDKCTGKCTCGRRCHGPTNTQGKNPNGQKGSPRKKKSAGNGKTAPDPKCKDHTQTLREHNTAFEKRNKRIKAQKAVISELRAHAKELRNAIDELHTSSHLPGARSFFVSSIHELDSIIREPTSGKATPAITADACNLGLHRASAVINAFQSGMMGQQQADVDADDDVRSRPASSKVPTERMEDLDDLNEFIEHEMNSDGGTDGAP